MFATIVVPARNPAAALRPWSARIVMVAALAAVAATIGLAPGALKAQDEPDPNDPGAVFRGVGVVETVAARDAVDRAIDVLSEAESAPTPDSKRTYTLEAVQKFHELLTEPAFRDTMIRRQSQGKFIGTREAIREVLAAAEPEVLAAYRDRFDLAAQNEVRRALLNRDGALLESVLANYPYSGSAIEAGTHAAMLAMESGRFDHASALCYRLLGRTDLQPNDGSVLVAIAAMCAAQLGAVNEAKEMTAMAETRYPQERIALGSSSRLLADYVREQQKLAIDRAMRPDMANSWRSFGGNWSNTQIAAVAVQPGQKNWQRPLPTMFDANNSESFRLNYPDFDLPRSFPVVSDATVYVANRSAVTAYNLFSGTPMWEFSRRLTSAEFWTRDVDPAVYYSATLDGDHLFVPLEGPLQKRLHSPTGTEEHRNNQLWGLPVIMHVPRRTLYAFDRRTGTVVWSMGGRFDDEKLKDSEEDTLSYPSAPTVVDDTVLVSGAKLQAENAHVYIAAFSREPMMVGARSLGRPRKKWLTKLVSNLTETNLFGRPTREPFPSGVAYASHRAYVCTNLGLVACVDSETGEPIWATPYTRIQFIPPVSVYPEFRPLSWAYNVPVVADGVLVVAPTDANELCAFDAKSGKALWTASRIVPGRQEQARYVIGVRNGRVYLGGDRTILELNLLTGKLVRAALAINAGRFGSAITGRPILAANRMYVPSDDGIVVIGLDEWKVLSTVTTGIGDMGGGNLCIGDGVLIAVNKVNSGASYDWEAILNDLKQRERQNPDSVSLKLRIANLCWQRGPASYAEAQRYFERVLELTANASSDELDAAAKDAHRGLFVLWLDQARRLKTSADKSAFSKALGEAEKHVREPQQGIELALVQWEAFRRADTSRVVGLLNDMIARMPQVRYEFPKHGQVKAEVFARLELADVFEETRRYDAAMQQWQVLLERLGDDEYQGRTMREFALTQVRRLIQVGGRAAYADIERRAKSELDAAVARRDPRGVLSVADRFPVAVAAEEALITLARWDVGDASVSPKGHEAELDRATDYLRRLLRDFPGSSYRAEAFALLALAYERREMFQAARSVLLQMQREFGSKKLSILGRDISAEDYVVETLKKPAYSQLKDTVILPDLADPELRLMQEFVLEGRSLPRLLETKNPPPLSVANCVYLWRMGGLECRDSATGDLRWVNADLTYAYAFDFVGDRVVAVGTSSVIAFDPSLGTRMWRRDLSEQVMSATIKDGVVAVMVRENRADQRHQYSLLVLNAEDGSVLGRSAQRFESAILSKPVVQNGVIIVFNNGVPGEVYGFSATQPGQPLFELRYNAALSVPPTIVDDQRFAVLTRDNVLMVHKLADGSMLNRMPVPPTQSDRLFVHGRALIFCLANGSLRAVDSGSGQNVWDRAMDRSDVFSSRSELVSGALYTLRRNGQSREMRAAVLDPSTGGVLWDTMITDDLNLDVIVQTLTSKHWVLLLRRIEQVTEDGRNVIRAACEIVILDRKTGAILQRFKPPTMTGNLSPTMLVLDRSLLVAGDDRVWKYGR